MNLYLALEYADNENSCFITFCDSCRRQHGKNFHSIHVYIMSFMTWNAASTRRERLGFSPSGEQYVSRAHHFTAAALLVNNQTGWPQKWAENVKTCFKISQSVNWWFLQQSFKSWSHVLTFRCSQNLLQSSKLNPFLFCPIYHLEWRSSAASLL